MSRSIFLTNSEGWPGIDCAQELLLAGANVYEVIESLIKATELEEQVRTVGFGGAPNALGVMQLDASFMDGNTLDCGSVGALEGIMHPILVARKVMEQLPHVTLVGSGAKHFALECGFKEQDLLSPTARQLYDEWREKNFREPLTWIFKKGCSTGGHGTVVCLAIDQHSNFAGGVSTTGWDYKYPGRVGDSPIIGAGLYIDKRFGGAACTHCGENAMRTVLAHSVVLYMKKGATVEEAVHEGIEDLAALKGDIQGQVVIYAFDRDGEYFVARRFKEPQCDYYVFHQGLEQVEKKEAISCR